MCANFPYPTHREGYVPVENAALYIREIGQGQPIIFLHGGPDFDHSYLLPDMDRLADSYRLIYYDQRGRGKSAPETRPEDISIQSEIEDLDELRKHLQLDSVAVLGHSWGGVLAMEYATRRPDCVSHMILMNTAAASYEDYLVMRQEVGSRKAVYQDELNAIVSSAAYQEGDPEAVAAYYRIHFQVAIKQQNHLERLLENMIPSFKKERIPRERAIESQLYKETWLSEGFNLLPRLHRLDIPTLVIHGDYDFIPAECAAHIAQAISGARFVLLKDCGHFSYLERPNELRTQIDDFFARA